MASYKLTYFNGRGRGELVRLCLAYAGQAFEDKRIERDVWPNMKSNLRLPFLPALVVDDKATLQETCLIAQYIAQKHGFGGESEEDKTVISSLTFYMEYIYNKATIMSHIPDEGRRKEMQSEFDEKTLPAATARLEECALKNEAGVLHGSAISQADIHFYNVFWTVKQTSPAGLFDKAPKLATLYEKVASHPRIAQWVASRPDSSY